MLEAVTSYEILSIPGFGKEPMVMTEEDNEHDEHVTAVRKVATLLDTCLFYCPRYLY